VRIKHSCFNRDAHVRGKNAVHSAARCTVLEAARVTSSARQFFCPIVIDNTEYVATGNNNPAAIAVDEANRIWGQGSQVVCLVSGVGIAPAVNWGPTKREIEVAVKAIIEDCSQVADQLKMKMQDRGLGHRYHRFSVHTTGSVKWEEWERTKDVVGRTKAYMEVMGHEARNAAQCLAQVCCKRTAVHQRLPLPSPDSWFSREDDIQYAQKATLEGRHIATVGGAGNWKSTIALDAVHCEEIEQSFTDLTQALEEISASEFAATALIHLLSFLITSATISSH
ncbi:hypothetical protein BT69DRAFT_1365587, partial [Atractiella rhizophila]